MTREQPKPRQRYRPSSARLGSRVTECARAIAAMAVAGGLALGLCTAAASAQGCPNEAPREQQGSTYLAQCRGYELASPVLKNEEEVLVQEVHGPQIPFQAAREGGAAREGRIAFTTLGALPESSSGGLYDEYVADSSTPRSTWSTLSLQPESQFLESYAREGSTGDTEYLAPDLSCGIEQTELPLPEHTGESQPQLPAGETAAERVTNLYVWHAGAGSGGAPGLESTKLISDEKPANAAESTSGTTYAVDGVSPGCKRVVFESEYRFLGAPAGTLYEWVEGPEGGKGTLRVASVLGEHENAQHQKEPVLARSVARAQMGELESNLNVLTSELVPDGEEISRLVFTATAETGPNDEREAIYLRQTHTAPAPSPSETASTIEVSASQGPSPDDTGARFQATSSDGQKIFFTANYGLTHETSTGSEAPSSCNHNFAHMGPGCDLYVYDLGTGKLTDLSVDNEARTGDKKGAGVTSVLGISDDGSVVYFSASGQLVQGKGNTQAYDELILKTEAEVAELVTRKIEAECSSFAEPERKECEEAGKHEPKFKEEVKAEHEAQQSKCAELALGSEQQRCAQLLAADEPKLPEANVYASRNGQTSYAATIDQLEAGGAGAKSVEELDAIAGQDGMHYEVSRVSPSGEYLLFATDLRVRESDGEEYDNRDQITGQPDYEYYEYSLASGGVTCVSCNPNRAERPIQRGLHSSSGAFQTNENGYLSRNLSNNGTVFLDSVDPLVSQARNNTVNVYQWQPEELEGCRPVAGRPGVGSVCLLDSGSDPNASYFADASADGENVFITTQQQLAPQDTDGLRDIYDVRIDGGILAQTVSSCSEEECQGKYSGLGSVTYTSESGVGGGNSTPQTPPPGPSGKGGVAAFTAHSVSVKHTVHGTKVAVAVSTPAAGRVSISGTGLKSVTKAESKAGVYRLEVALTAKEKQLLKRRKHVKLTLHIRFAPSSGHASTINTSVSFT